jgi:hypothetical protein
MTDYYPMNEARAAQKAAFAEIYAEAGVDDSPPCTQNSPAVVRKIEDANKAVRAADAAATKATVKGKEAGKVLIRLREAVKAESPGVAWSVWCADYLGHFGIRTIERYIALVETPKPIADDDAGAVEATLDAVTTAPRRNADATNAVRQKRHRDKLNELRGKPLKGKEVSAKTEIMKHVKGLSERRARELLGQIKEWIGEDE